MSLLKVLELFRRVSCFSSLLSLGVMSKSGISGKHSSMLLTGSAVGGAMLLGYLIGRSKFEYDVFLDFSQGENWRYF